MIQSYITSRKRQTATKTSFFSLPFRHWCKNVKTCAFYWQKLEIFPTSLLELFEGWMKKTVTQRMNDELAVRLFFQRAYATVIMLKLT